MLPKVFCIFLILTLSAIVLVAEARGGRGRGGSVGGVFYRRSHKKHSSSSGTGSRRRLVSGSPVHTEYTRSVIAAESGNPKFGKHGSSRHRSRSHGHKSHSSYGGHSRHGGYGGQSHSEHHSGHSEHHSGHSGHHSGHSDHSGSKHHTDTSYSRAHYGTQSHHQKSRHNWNSVAYDNSPYISHNWGGHQLPPGHVYITQTSSIPPNAVYYAQPPRHSSLVDDSADFALGYLIGNNLFSHNHHHHSHHVYHHYRETSQNSNNALAENPSTDFNYIINSSTSTTHRPHYWPMDGEVALAPLNNTLLPNASMQITQVPIFKPPPIVNAQKLQIDNETFELPAATAPPPSQDDIPPEHGIICMPWTFNETDPIYPERVISVEKTICFPAPPAPTPPPTTPPPSTVPVAGDIGVDQSAASTQAPVDKCKDAVCPTSIGDFDFLNIDMCCFRADKLLAMSTFINEGKEIDLN